MNKEPAPKVFSPKTIDEELGKQAMIQQQQRRKGVIGIKEWIVISKSGDLHVEESGKQSIMRRTGLPARDLRTLDPALSDLSTILGRERAIVINLEHIKAIVTANEVFMMKSTNPLVVQFIQDLQNRVSSSRDPPVSNNGDSNTSKTGTLEVQKLFPFEFQALEASLESACRCLETETETLEQEAYPALDALSSKIITQNLEHVRQIKSRLVAISGRVQKARDELEHLLDDDNDMAEMYLTRKCLSRSVEEREEFNDEELESEERNEENNSEHSSDKFTSTKLNVGELEMLLEAYFAQITGISQKLFQLKEYVDDTEDYINIMLDNKQNQLLEMGVMLSIVNMIVSAGIVMFGILGMNIHIDLFHAPTKIFWTTAAGTCVGCFLLYFIAYGWGKSKRIF